MTGLNTQGRSYQLMKSKVTRALLSARIAKDLLVLFLNKVRSIIAMIAPNRVPGGFCSRDFLRFLNKVIGWSVCEVYFFHELSNCFTKQLQSPSH